MPRSELVLQVFVASPSDVKVEREALESVIAELNRTWSKKLSLRLELNRWETSIYPGFGSDPQEVINKQIGDNYDIFIGILWGRVGTPTPRAQSGTLEEFERAYSKYQRDPDSIELMIYFKDAPIAPSNINTDQLSAVKKFRSGLGEQGGLYWTFETTSEFESTLRSHLSLVSQRWAEKIARKYPDTSSSLPKQEETENSDEDSSVEVEKGLLDYYQSLEQQAAEMDAALRMMAEATIDIGQQINRRSEEMLSIGVVTDRDSQREVGKIINLVSQDMDRYSSILEFQIPKFSTSRDNVFESLSKALMLFEDFTSDEDSFVLLENQLMALTEGISESKQGLLAFRNSVSVLPRISGQLNKAKRNIVDVLDKSLKEFNLTLEMIQNIQSVIFQQKQKLRRDNSDVDTLEST
jgi:hypothetical protein